MSIQNGLIIIPFEMEINLKISIVIRILTKKSDYLFFKEL